MFLTDDQETISQIASDDRVTQAYTGKYAVSEWETINGTDGKYVEKIYDNALYVNTGHPYRMVKIMNEMIEDYGVDQNSTGICPPGICRIWMKDLLLY